MKDPDQIHISFDDEPTGADWGVATDAFEPTQDVAPAWTPAEPETFEAAGLRGSAVEHLVLKVLLEEPGLTGNEVARKLCLHPGPVRHLLQELKRRMLLVHARGSAAGDFHFDLAESGRQKAVHLREGCPYAGPAPVTLEAWKQSIWAQSITRESPDKGHLERAFGDLQVDGNLLAQLGPAMNAGRGLFMFGNSGNGKTSFALRMIEAYDTSVYIPHTVTMNGTIVQVFDPAVHKVVPVPDDDEPAWGRKRLDRRWVQVRRPVVVAGGELTLESLELEQTAPGLCEAPLQVKANTGILVIDDFGRQSVEPSALLNRWIVPLENRVDYLRTPNGRKLQVPFDTMLVISTNLDPKDLVDEAFLRRLPYKVRFHDPNPEQFSRLMLSEAEKMGFCPDQEPIDWLVRSWYLEKGRPMRYCHPRDLLLQVRHRCLYNDAPLELNQDNLDAAARAYFTLL